jgi:hypothetical protein
MEAFRIDRFGSVDGIALRSSEDEREDRAHAHAEFAEGELRVSRQ